MRPHHGAAEQKADLPRGRRRIGHPRRAQLLHMAQHRALVLGLLRSPRRRPRDHERVSVAAAPLAVGEIAPYTPWGYLSGVVARA